MTDPFCFSLVLQLLVVVSPDWNAIEGTLYRYQRAHSALQWELAGAPIPVTLGKHGMAWGRGLHDLGDHKREGDGRSPAGLFSVGTAFGDVLHQSFARNIPFLLVTDDLECVDDPRSLYYNQFVTADSVERRDWTTSEKMKEIGSLYALGLVIEHNLNPIEAGMGSAIFMHIWESPGTGTAGCTTMAENDLNEVVAWLDAEQHPCLVQLPFEEYRNKKSQWGLPELPSNVSVN